jgi:hypothetical protein
VVRLITALAAVAVLALADMAAELVTWISEASQAGTCPPRALMMAAQARPASASTPGTSTPQGSDATPHAAAARTA